MNLNGNTDILKPLKRTKTNTDNPLRPDAFALSDKAKIEQIAGKFSEILDILGLDLTDDSVKDTPQRVARMYINEIFKGLNPANRPKIAVFNNTYGYHNPLIEMHIPVNSFCEHHFLPVQGVANVAYIPGDFVIGLSKIHRLVDFCARRPQVQERLTMQIAGELTKTLHTPDVGVVIRATHGCISCRGVEEKGTATLTSVFNGELKNSDRTVEKLMEI